jgi:hypothetical protein
MGQELLLPCQNVHFQTVKSFLSLQSVFQMKIGIDEEVDRPYHWEYCKTSGLWTESPISEEAKPQ